MSNTRTIELKLTDGDRLRVTIPADAKITFAGVNPQGRGGYERGCAVRIYQGTEKHQLAVFVGVESFRDLSLPVQRLVRKREEKQRSKNDGRGNSQAEREVRVEDAWLDENEASS